MNKNIIIIASIILVLGVLGIAQTGNSDLITGMFGYNININTYSPNAVLCFVILKVLAIAFVSFIFSLIFWYTHKWVMGYKKK